MAQAGCCNHYRSSIFHAAVLVEAASLLCPFGIVFWAVYICVQLSYCTYLMLLHSTKASKAFAIESGVCGQYIRLIITEFLPHSSSSIVAVALGTTPTALVAVRFHLTMAGES